MSVGQNQPAVIAGTVISGSGIRSALNITASTVLKNVNGRVCTVNVIVAGSAAGGIYDHQTVSGTGVANAVAIIPEAAGTYKFDFPCQTGIVVTPPIGGTMSVSFA